MIDEFLDLIGNRYAYCMTKWWGRLLSIFLTPFCFVMIVIVTMLVAVILTVAGTIQWIITGKTDILPFGN